MSKQPEQWEDNNWVITYHRDRVDALIAKKKANGERTLVLSNAHNFVLDRLRNQGHDPSKVLSNPLIQRYLRIMKTQEEQ